MLEDDVGGRDAVRDEVIMVVISSFQKFAQKQKAARVYCFVTPLLLDWNFIQVHLIFYVLLDPQLNVPHLHHNRYESQLRSLFHR